MAPLRERSNFFGRRFRVAPRPFLPEHWDVPETPSAVRFWVHADSGRTASRPSGPDWILSKTLRLWHVRQSLRVWACHRLLRRHGEEEARHRIASLEKRLIADVPGPNTYLDLILAIAYEVCRLNREHRLTARIIAEASERAASDAHVWRRLERRVRRRRPQLALSLDAVVSALDRALAATLSVTDNGRPRGGGSTVARLLRAAQGRRPGKLVWEWIGYQSLPRNHRDPDLSWLLAQAVLKSRDARDEATVEVARGKVFRLLEDLDASPSAEEKGYSSPPAGLSDRTLATSSANPASS